MLNIKEKEIIENYIEPILTQMDNYYFDIDNSTEWFDVKKIIRKDIESIRAYLRTLLVDKYVKLTSAGVVRRHKEWLNRQD